MATRPVGTCVHCGRSGLKIYYKSLCSRDAKAVGHEYPSVRVPMDDRLDDWRVYKERGMTVQEASVKMGMRPNSLGQILIRAKKAGKL